MDCNVQGEVTYSHVLHLTLRHTPPLPDARHPASAAALPAGGKNANRLVFGSLKPDVFAVRRNCSPFGAQTPKLAQCMALTLTFIRTRCTSAHRVGQAADRQRPGMLPQLGGCISVTSKRPSGDSRDRTQNMIATLSMDATIASHSCQAKGRRNASASALCLLADTCRKVSSHMSVLTLLLLLLL
jgi:hypothetical protein